jgi:hypothetical protein
MIEIIIKYKKNKYKNEVPDSKKELSDDELIKIKSNLKSIDFENWYKIPYYQRYEIFFEKVFYKKDNKIFLDEELLELDSLNDDEINIFEKFTNSEK